MHLLYVVESLTSEGTPSAIQIVIVIVHTTKNQKYVGKLGSFELKLNLKALTCVLKKHV